MILDSCNSGTATRSADAGTYVARQQPAADEQTCPAGTNQEIDDETIPSDGKWLSEESVSGAVIFTAARRDADTRERGRGRLYQRGVEGIIRGEKFPTDLRPSGAPDPRQGIRRELPDPLLPW